MINQESQFESFGLFYDKEKNVFVDEDGFVIWNLWDMITPNDLFLFHKKRQYMCFNHRSFKNTTVEFYYPEDD